MAVSKSIKNSKDQKHLACSSPTAIVDFVLSLTPENKKISATVLGVATGVYLLFEVLEYHLLTLLCHVLMLSLIIIFVYSKFTTFLSKSSVQIPEVVIPEKIVLDIAMSTRFEINRALFHLREIAAGMDLKRFLVGIAGLWVLSIVGSWCSFLTLTYTRTTQVKKLIARIHLLVVWMMWIVVV